MCEWPAHREEIISTDQPDEEEEEEECPHDHRVVASAKCAYLECRVNTKEEVVVGGGG